jgi:hypothetical protein
MTLLRSVGDVLSDHVVFELESIDRMYPLSGLAGGSSQFTGQARNRADTFLGHDRIPESGSAGGTAVGFAGAYRRPVGVKIIRRAYSPVLSEISLTADTTVSWAVDDNSTWSSSGPRAEEAARKLR